MKYKRHVWIFTSLIGIFVLGFAIPGSTYAGFFIITSSKNYDIIPFNWIIILLGGIIMLTLSYVSWRKYKGMQNKRNKQREKKSNS
ncbi:sporulation protein YpjB [Virgibacillus sp. W0181]|uniref:sporulation protein YpjB n=1 Tax=Virgibacillus sp. W0181 TaxID=3391581 RepID=UPI003F4832FF